MTVRFRLTVKPGVSLGTSTILCCLYLSALLGSVLPMTIKILQRSRAAPEIHHLRPFKTYSSPSRWMENWMLVASELATSGSVMAKAERIRGSQILCHQHPVFHPTRR